MTKWLVALALAQALDTTTTCVGLSRGYRELNPLLANRSCQQVIAVKAGVTAGLILPLALAHRRNPSAKWPKGVALGATITTAGAAGWNLHMLFTW